MAPAIKAAGASDSASAPAPLDCGIELPYWQAEDTRFLGPLRHAAVGNHRLAYRRIPPLYASALPAPPLALLLGYGQTMGAFSPRLLRALAQSREVVLYDQPAQGLSEETDPSTDPIGLDTLAEALLGFVDALHLGRPDLAGWSLGACLALKLAAQHPQRIGRVVSWAGTFLDGRAVLGEPQLLAGLFNPTNTPPDYAPAFFSLRHATGRRAACRWIADLAAAPDGDDAKPETNARYVAGIHAALQPNDLSIWQGLGRTPTPVLLMSGTADELIPLHAQLELVGHIPAAWMAQFPEASHAFFLQHISRVVATMDAFLLAETAAADDEACIIGELHVRSNDAPPAAAAVA
ncbi:alpha beta hydrolase [Micractinium conductrix]|uniref:Alpha beta hydrolase n=1 Tax=Micractinium conductrix TaxID=554055 RepID=A0A2P6VPX0_9CHLO|nr:alpha beta hydrolase [Micractinium conductrix]|eukprot:PSC76131.1 alpha beta hydrolase [Micractinium conductrix]